MIMTSSMDNTEYEGGYDLKLVNKETNLNCSICLLLIRDAMGTPCSHVFCKVCLQKLTKRSDIMKAIFECPDCKQAVNEVYPNPFVNRLVTGSDVFCKHREAGCKWKGSLASYFQEHDSSCEKAPMPCPHEECVSIVPKSEMEDHLNHKCQFVIVSCHYATFGCTEKITRRDMEKHDQSSMNNHMNLMYNQIIQSKNEIDNLRQENTSTKQQLHEHTKEIEKQRNEIRELKEQSFSSKAENKDHKEDTKHQPSDALDDTEKDPPFAPTYNINELLSQGTEKWIRRKDVQCFDLNYKNWYTKIFDLMIEKKLYISDNGMFVKIRNEGYEERLYWNSNSEKRQKEMTGKSGGLKVIGNEFALFINTATLESFNHKNSSPFVLLPKQWQKMKKGFGGKDWNGWVLQYIPDHKVNKFLIVCLVNTLLEENFAGKNVSKSSLSRNFLDFAGI